MEEEKENEKNALLEKDYVEDESTSLMSHNVDDDENNGTINNNNSGKSSLMITLVQICKIKTDGGKILINGVDTKQSKTDEELWDALVEVQLTEVIAALPVGLDEL
eukprot:10716172-Ditylum_brightwellii.AAC.1